MSFIRKEITLLLLIISLFVFSFTTACGNDHDTVTFVALPNGNFLCLWYEQVNETFVIQASSSKDGITWDPGTTISDVSQDSTDPIIEFDDQSNVVALWKAMDRKQKYYGLASAKLRAGGVWETPVVITDSNELLTGEYELQINAVGTIVVIWCALQNTPDHSGYTTLVRTANSSFDGKWSTPITINAPK